MIPKENKSENDNTGQTTGHNFNFKIVFRPKKVEKYMLLGNKHLSGHLKDLDMQPQHHDQTETFNKRGN